jgi:hypothetical protein
MKLIYRKKLLLTADYNRSRSPETAPFRNCHPKDFYNLTATYRLDSDFTYLYGHVTDLHTQQRVAPSINVKWREPDVDFHGEIEPVQV